MSFSFIFVERIPYTVRENSVGLFYAVRSKWFESTHRNKICEYTIIHYLIFFIGIVASLVRAMSHMCFSCPLIPSVRIVSVPCAGFDSMHKDKILFLLIHNCECIVSTRSVRIALILSSFIDETIFTCDGFEL